MTDAPDSPRDALIYRLEAEYFQLLELIDDLTLEEISLPGVVGHWSIKDIIAHIVYWNWMQMSEIAAAQVGLQPQPQPGDDDTLNAQAVARYQDLFIDHVLSDFSATYEMLMAAVRALPENAFHADSDFAGRLGGAADAVLTEQTADHWAEHTEHIRVWLQRDQAHG